MSLFDKIKETTLNESSQYSILKKDNSFKIELSEYFKRVFSDDVDIYNDYVINELNKLDENISIYKVRDYIIVEPMRILKEAEYQGKDVDLNKPMRGDVKKYKVFVKDPKTKNVKKVNFGDKNMEIKRDDPERRKSFRARHKCDSAKDKTTPRYWSCKFWSGKSVSDLLSEVVEPDSINVDQLKMKDELCPKIWDGDHMKPEIRKVLLKNAIEFIKFSKVESLKFKDIILTGSLANYTYTDSSDLDIHILLDFDQISDDKEFIGEYFKNKKNIWHDRYPTHARGHEIELYFQDSSEPHTSTGVYSILNDEWLTKPTNKMIAIDTPNVQLKSAHIMNAIDDIESSADGVDVSEKVDALMDRIKKMRKSGLEDEGEFSTENIVFKILRNNGYLEKLVNLKKDYFIDDLTLEEIFR